MFPVYVLKEGVQLPEDGTYYIVAKNGLFLRKDTGIVQSTVKVDGVAFLAAMGTSARLKLPLLAPELVARSLLFFRSVYRQHHGEAEVQLHYNSETKEYLLHCPEQKVSAAGVDYDSKERFDGFQLVGTIHSHCGFGAFHSSIDHNDEKYFDGLHITIGHVDQPYFTISCSIMVNGQRFALEPDGVAMGLKKVAWQQKSVPFYRRQNISHFDLDDESREVSLVGRFFGCAPSTYAGPAYAYTGGYVETKPAVLQFWDIAMPEGQDYRHVGFPRHWLDRVKRLSLPVVVSSYGYTPSHTPGVAIGRNQRVLAPVTSLPTLEAEDATKPGPLTYGPIDDFDEEVKEDCVGL